METKNKIRLKAIMIIGMFAFITIPSFAQSILLQTMNLLLQQQQHNQMIINQQREQNLKSRSEIRNSISKWGQCKDGCITNSYGSVVLYSSNGYSYCGNCPQQLTTALKDKNNNGVVLNDVTITDQGKWLLIFDNNNFIGQNIPQSMQTQLNSIFNAIPNDTIQSASFNDANEWVIVTSKYFYTSSEDFTNILRKNIESYGKINTVSIFNDGCIACYKSGFYSLGNVPSIVISAANSFKIHPYIVKFDNCGNYLICTKNGNYSYNLNDISDFSSTPTMTVPPVYVPQHITSPDLTPSTGPQLTFEKVKCSYCNGTGRINSDDTPTYGSTEQKWCSECGCYVSESHCHGCKTCPSCSGKGYTLKSVYK